jgi:mono/diheme cytochrome c family protein
VTIARAIAVMSVLMMACDGLWPASMEQQPAVRPLAEARPAPAGSIPLGGVETLDDREDDADLKSPYPLDDAAAARGAAVFAIHCIACHGPAGRGDGPVSAKFPPAPNLRHVSICQRTDGFLYGTLTAGGRAMPTMREGTTSHDRWDLVAFVRALQREGCTGTTAAPGATEPTAPATSPVPPAPSAPAAHKPRGVP